MIDKGIAAGKKQAAVNDNEYVSHNNIYLNY